MTRPYRQLKPKISKSISEKMATAYYNQQAVEYYIKERIRFGWSARGERAVKFGKIKTGDDVLDLCCGPGFVAKVIRGKIGPSGKLIGIDYSRDFIKYAKNLCQSNNVIFKCGNVENLERYVDKQKFDVVLLLASWLWIKNKDKLLLKIKRVLKPDGRFILSLSADNLYHPLTKEFHQRFRQNVKREILINHPKIMPVLSSALSKAFVDKTIFQIKKKGFQLISVNEVFRQLTENDKLFLYRNPARTEWVGPFKPEERFRIIQKSLKKAFQEIGRDNLIQRHTYYIVSGLK